MKSCNQAQKTRCKKKIAMAMATQFNIVNLFGAILFSVIQCSLQGYPFDGIYFVESGKADKRKLHQAGWDNSYRVYVARLTLEDGAQIVGAYTPDLTGSHIYFAYSKHMRYIRDHKEYKVEFLQHTTNGGINWIYTYKQWKPDPKFNLTMVIGKMPDGDSVKVCRAFPEDNNRALMIGRHHKGRDGCIIHWKNKQLAPLHFEVMGISFLGMREGLRRLWGSTKNYCTDMEYCVRPSKE